MNSQIHASSVLRERVEKTLRATDGTEEDIHQAPLNLGLADVYTVCYRKRPCIIKYH